MAPRAPRKWRSLRGARGAIGMSGAQQALMTGSARLDAAPQPGEESGPPETGKGSMTPAKRMHLPIASDTCERRAG